MATDGEANEGSSKGSGENAKEVTKEVTKEVNGGEEAAPATGPQRKVEAKSRNQTNYSEYLDDLKQMHFAQAKVHGQFDVIGGLIKKKEGETDKKNIAAVAKELTKAHHDYLRLVDEYNKWHGIVTYRYPEHSDLKMRGYRRINEQSIEELEQQLSVEGKIKRIMKVMAKQYKAPTLRAPAQDTGGGPAGASRSELHLEPTVPTLPKIAEPIILKK